MDHSDTSQNECPGKESTEWGPVLLIPLLASAILFVTVFLLVIFRHIPTLVISTVAACLIFISIYLLLFVLDASKEVLA
ncbi:hypothetical protein JTB14_023150 [Gonioctena quinquepunctata]|nr:hypothetical protein JTB14_023150 [Gonioctena quinquepunctata]